MNIGYACINMQLSSQKPKVYTGRSMIKRTFKARGIEYASELGLQNCKDLFEIVKWNNENGFPFFRITSNLFPWSSEYKLEDMPDYFEIGSTLANVGKYVADNNMRITSHPGPFNVLTSPHPHVVDNCINDLSTHGEVFDMMGLSRTPYNKINIHIGGAYGDKESAMARFCTNFVRLPDSVKSRLTVENDDKATMYSVRDLYDGVYKVIGIPIVFDYHHHQFCTGDLTEQKALELAIKTWGDIKPVVHYSESRRDEKKDDTIRVQAHSDYVYEKIETYGHDIDIMVEAKAKELAVQKYLELHNGLS
jgi:UV DNA damage endonuclease|tara:strand:+ start:1263 stop:2180 length:918 start_codon:yes stop_codon:yes gene_type:complete